MTSRTAKDLPIEKIYFTTGEVARELKEPDSVIRFWMSKVGIQPKRRDCNNGFLGYRQITAREFDLIKKVKYLVRERRFTLEGAKMEIKKLNNAG